MLLTASDVAIICFNRARKGHRHVISAPPKIMPRARKQVARFDPSPESVASWNDTSSKLRLQVDLQARVRHGLLADEAAAALVAANLEAEAAKAAKAARARSAAAGGAASSSLAGPSAPAPGRKRQRATTAVRRAGVGSGASSASSYHGSGPPTWPLPISGMRAGQLQPGEAGLRAGATGGVADAAVRGGGGGSSRHSRVGSSVTDSSLSCSTSGSGSGSDSDSSYSCGSLRSAHRSTCANANKGAKLPWRGRVPLPTTASVAYTAEELSSESAAAAAAAAGSAGTAGATAADVGISASGTDTDSEYCSDLIPGPMSSASATTSHSDGCSSCSTPLPVRSDGDILPGLASEVGCGERGSGGGCADSTHAEDGHLDGRIPPGESSRPRSDGDDDQQQRTKERRRNVVTVRLARSQMPARWAAAPPPFKTCLGIVRPQDKLGGDMEGGCAAGGDDAAAAAAASILGLSEGEGVDAKNWLTSGFIDVVMAKFARTYPNVHFMPIDFAVLGLRGWGSSETAATPRPAPPSHSSSSSTASAAGSEDGEQREAEVSGAAGAVDESMVFKDILGRPIVYSEKRPVIFLTHVNNVHWNLLRVEHDPVPELQLFEPMGKPPRRQGASRSQAGRGPTAPSSSRGTGFRCIPKEVYRWLDAVWPLGSANGGVDRSPDGSADGCRGEGPAAAAAAKGGNATAGTKRKAPSSAVSSQEEWASRAYSAITRQQQTTGFDCGVAALLYAEKCGQGHMREDVDAWTTQGDMTEYRRALQRYVEEVLRPAGETPNPHQASTVSGPSEDAPALPLLSAAPSQSPLAPDVRQASMLSLPVSPLPSSPPPPPPVSSSSSTHMAPMDVARPDFPLP